MPPPRVLLQHLKAKSELEAEKSGVKKRDQPPWTQPHSHWSSDASAPSKATACKSSQAQTCKHRQAPSAQSEACEAQAMRDRALSIAGFQKPSCAAGDQRFRQVLSNSPH